MKLDSTRALVAVVAALIAGGVVYGVWSNIEWSGTVLLLLGGGFAAISGGYLVLQARLQRHLTASSEATAAPEEQPYLPHASIWPFALGLGATITLLGFVLGRMILVLGAAVTVHALVGWVGQSRRRA